MSEHKETPTLPAGEISEYCGYTLSARPDGMVSLLAPRPDAHLVTRNCMAFAIEFIDSCVMSMKDFEAKYGEID